jgi:hypothetical protein
MVRSSIEWLNSDEGEAFIDAHANEAGVSDGQVDTDLEQDYLGIRGLVYLPQFLPAGEQGRVLAEIDNLPWLGDLRRRVQHYGYKYDDRARSIDWMRRIIARTSDHGIPRGRRVSLTYRNVILTS